MLYTEEFRQKMRAKAIANGVNPDVADDMLEACARVYKPGLPEKLNRAFFHTAMTGVANSRQNNGTFTAAKAA